MRVVVADDSETQRVLLLSLVRRMGLEAIGVDDGPAAVALLSAEDGPALGLIDWQMPGLEGPEVCARVRASARQLQPFLVLVTAKVEAPELTRAFDVGADDCWVKPVVPARLAAAVRQATRSLGLQRENQARAETLATVSQQLKATSCLLASLEAAPHEPTWSGAADAITRTHPAFHSFPAHVSGVLSAVGLQLDDGGPMLAAHAAVAVPNLGVWIDVVLDVPQQSLRRAKAMLFGSEQSDAFTAQTLLAMLMAGLDTGQTDSLSLLLEPRATSMPEPMQHVEHSTLATLNIGALRLHFVEALTPAEERFTHSLESGLFVLGAEGEPVEEVTRHSQTRTRAKYSNRKVRVLAASAMATRLRARR